MRRLISQAFLGASVLLGLLWGGLAGQEPVPPANPEPKAMEKAGPAAEDIVRSEPIGAGYVILEGRYVAPPYVLEKRGAELWINDQLVSAHWFSWWAMRGRGGVGGPFSRGGGPRPGGGPLPPAPAGRGAPDGQYFTHLKGVLNQGSMIIDSSDFRTCILSPGSAASLVDILSSPGTREEKLLRIGAEVPEQVEPGAWEKLIAIFEPSEELSRRMAPAIQELQKIMAENRQRHDAAVASAFWTSKPVKYVTQLVAMGLIVAACGTLLNYRPIGRVRWSEVDASGDGVPIVIRSVVLLVLLGIFDLACTLVAEQAGGFTEMNPLGSRIVQNPLALIAFKLTTLLMACSILYALRRYRGAQVAAWWMCLLCTVLTFRWITYNSMFMS